MKVRGEKKKKKKRQKAEGQEEGNAIKGNRAVEMSLRHRFD